MSISYNANLQKNPRHFLPSTFQITDFQSISPFFTQLNNTDITSLAQLEKWLQQISELQAAINEDACWRQIKMTCNTTDASLEEAYTYFCTELQPPITAASNELNIKLMACPFVNELSTDKYAVYLQQVKRELDLFTEKNIPLQSEESVLGQQFGSISSKMNIEVEGKTYTMQQAMPLLMQDNRELRKEVYSKIATRRLQDQEPLNILFDKLLVIRHQIAINAGFENYRDFKFAELGRTDYTVTDCENFHEAIKLFILPLCEKIYAAKKSKLGLEVLHVYDIEAEPSGTQPLQPFRNGTDLLQKSISVFNKLHPFFGECLQTMQDRKQVDLDSRQGKAPGGYNCPLAETGVPFIFMNAAGTADDVVTMMHEGGHAIHSFVCHSLPLNAFKEYPMEIAELASMSMELFTMEHWAEFYSDASHLQRAKAEELERVLTILPWIATIDKFQHWLYTHVGHTPEERTIAWKSILKEFSVSNISYEGFEEYRDNFWQKQLHLFEVPFYYIEYGIAQLGAIGMWMQYQQNPQQALQNYLAALQLGNTKGLAQLYQAAGLELDFGAQRVQQLSSFVNAELEKLL
jgi:oligoendopeptidase F